jgi:hypothetical protein
MGFPEPGQGASRTKSNDSTRRAAGGKHSLRYVLTAEIREN